MLCWYLFVMFANVRLKTNIIFEENHMKYNLLAVESYLLNIIFQISEMKSNCVIYWKHDWKLMKTLYEKRKLNLYYKKIIS